ncbi:hypothetical protein PDN28_21970 [Bacillus cereus]|nr:MULTISPECIES: hypothetical protein [Bacillus cereus group]EEK59727.1 hypothetical protein bcere0005_46850 [Bacillus cereus 172560W]KAB7656771.1 hypothetical protein GBN78_11035 [Bacillus sp. B2-WWTP-C-10-Post-4]PKS15345.1 hypothetical protein CX118_19050 [Bacillus sp. BI3]MCU5569141.1 hypothetical protein [Bacillus cereus]MDA2268534.1 hypothetical protein [Bacillus cereus]
MKQPTVLAAGAGYHLKAEVACSECERDGAFDVEALFASQEKAKPPNILATGAGYYFKAKAACSESLFSIDWSRMLVHEIYISDFSNISAIPPNISAIFQLYRRFPPIYQRFFNYIDLSTNHDNINKHLSPTFINILQSHLC